MKIMLVTECKLGAYKRTEQLTSKYLDRVGRRTFSGDLSLLAIDNLIGELTDEASINTSIRVYKIHKNKRNELIKAIGNQRSFNEGIINHKTEDLVSLEKGNVFDNLLVITQISALLHDIGKATLGFQEMLVNAIENKNKKINQPFRHEYVSFIICAKMFDYANNEKNENESVFYFLSTVGNLRAALDFGLESFSKMTKIERSFKSTLGSLMKYSNQAIEFNNPKSKKTQFELAINWLVLTHHKLPHSTLKNGEGVVDDSLFVDFKYHINESNFESCPKTVSKYTTIRESTKLWKAKRKNKWMTYLSDKFKDLDEIFFEITDVKSFWYLVSFYCRPCLVYGDYIGSSDKEVCEEQDPDIMVYANTDNRSGQNSYADSLETHLIKVHRESGSMFNQLHKLSSGVFKDDFKTIRKDTRNAFVSQILSSENSTPEQFMWQVDSATRLDSIELDTPVFGDICAGTGTGKTRGCAISAIAPRSHPRFTVALGMKSLTTQTYREYIDELNFKEADVSLLIGSTLQESGKVEVNDKEVTVVDDKIQNDNSSGTDNVIEVEKESYIIQSGVNYKLSNERLKVLSSGRKSSLLIKSPIVVMTIDHFTPSIDPRKSHNLTNLLRIASSDLIIDEVDSYNAENLGALGLLVLNHALFGRNVFLSSATANPHVISHLSECYRAGIKAFKMMHPENRNHMHALFSEFIGNNFIEFANGSYIEFYYRKIDKITELINNKIKKNKASWLEFDDLGEVSELDNIYKNIISTAKNLHSKNHVKIENKTFSVGLVRFNNVKYAQKAVNYLKENNCDSDTEIKVVCYHSRHDIITRTFYEHWMGRNLKRKTKTPNFQSPSGSETILNDEFIKPLLQLNKKNIVIIFLTTTIIEVGRDVDFDWGITEPSTAFGLIQLAGRLRRHRNFEAPTPNLMIMNRTIKEVLGEKNPFAYPGVEQDKIGKLPIYPIREDNKELRKVLKSLKSKEVIINEISTDLFSNDFLVSLNASSLLNNGENSNSRILQLEHIRHLVYQKIHKAICYFNSTELFFSTDRLYKEDKSKKSNNKFTFLHDTDFLKSSRWFEVNKLRDSEKKISLCTDISSDLKKHIFSKSSFYINVLDKKENISGIDVTHELNDVFLFNIPYDDMVDFVSKYYSIAKTTITFDVSINRYRKMGDGNKLKIIHNLGVIDD